MAYGKLWAQVAALLGSGIEHEAFWQLALAYRARLEWMPRGSIWKALAVPSVSRDGVVDWVRVDSLGTVTPDRETDRGLSLRRGNGALITSYGALGRLVGPTDVHGRLTELVLCMATAQVSDDRVSLRIDPPCVADEAACGDFLGLLHDWREKRVRLLPFRGDISDCIAVGWPLALANADHPLVRLAHDADYLSSQSELQRFAAACVRFLTDSVGVSTVCSPGRRVDRWAKWIGTRALGIDWSVQDGSLCPPYRLWVEGQGHASVDIEDFRRWAGSTTRRTRSREQS